MAGYASDCSGLVNIKELEKVYIIVSVSFKDIFPETCIEP